MRFTWHINRTSSCKTTLFIRSFLLRNLSREIKRLQRYLNAWVVYAVSPISLVLTISLSGYFARIKFSGAPSDVSASLPSYLIIQVSRNYNDCSQFYETFSGILTPRWHTPGILSRGLEELVNTVDTSPKRLLLFYNGNCILIFFNASIPLNGWLHIY